MSTLKNFDNVSLLKQLVDSFWQLYFFYNVKQNSFELLSPAITQLLEKNEEEVLKSPKSLFEFVHPEDKEFVINQYKKLIVDRSIERLEKIEFRIVMPNKQHLKWLSVAAQLFEEKEEVYIGGYVEDITDKKEYLYNILKFNAKKNATLEILSHDLAAPFANIEGLGYFVEQQLSNENEDVIKAINLIKDNAIKGSDMIRDFVDDEFLESSQITLKKERIDMALRSKVLINDYQQKQELVGKQFEIIAKEKPVFMYVDEMKFLQVLNNLISNAIKFTEDNGKITLTIEERENSVLFSVADNGIGIPRKMHKCLFDKFTKARREGIRGEKSVGLGMSIIKNIVQWHNGRIWFESEEGKGSVFYIELPKE